MNREVLQELWSGYGVIERVTLQDGSTRVVKRVSPPDRVQHPRGWSGSVGHRRKLRSYQVEQAFYREFAADCPVRTAHVFELLEDDDGWTFVFEDLDAAGFSRRRCTSDRAVAAVVGSLAQFHRHFLGSDGRGLWERGTYWHLETRPEELAEMEDSALKRSAAAIDAALRKCPIQTLVHGDAKLANVCFGDDESQVAWVDFQYVGPGIGLSDLAYFLGSVYGDADLEHQAPRWLASYFETLDDDGVQAAWEPLWPVVWADFERFLTGWAPRHRKRSGFSARMTQRGVAVVQ